MLPKYKAGRPGSWCENATRRSGPLRHARNELERQLFLFRPHRNRRATWNAGSSGPMAPPKSRSNRLMQGRGLVAPQVGSRSRYATAARQRLTSPLSPRASRARNTLLHYRRQTAGRP